MNRLRIAALMVLLVAGVYAQQPLRPATAVAVVNGMLLEGYEARPIDDGVVVFEDGRIVAVGSAHRVTIPDGAAIIDAGGKTIMPGLIDAHVHTDLIGHGDYDRYYRFLDGTARLNEVMPIAAKQMLRAGVTSALDLGTPLEILSLRERIDRGELPGPRLMVSGPWITRVSLAGLPLEYQMVIGSPREGADRARELIERGADVIKTWVGLSRQDYQAIVDAAHERDVQVHAHVYHPDAIRAALDAGVDVLQHAGSARNPPYDPALVARIAHDGTPVVQTISHRIWVYPATVAFPARLRDPVHRRDMPADIYAEVIDSFEDFHRLPYFHDIGSEIRNAERAARQFIDAGAVMGVGTDAASPLNFHTDAIAFEMRALVESGMTPLQVISAATKTNAEIIGRFDELGTLEPGKLADLIVVDGDPLADIGAMAHIDLVVRDGVIWYPEHAVDETVRRIGHAF